MRHGSSFPPVASPSPNSEVGDSVHTLMRTLLIVAVMMLATVRGVAADWPLKGLPDEAQLAYQVLCRADVFAFGPIGVGAFTSEGELSVRILMRYPNAVAI